MAFEQEPVSKSWMPPEGYYEQRAESDVNPYLHFAGRFLVSAATIAMYGRPKVVTSAGFEDARPQFDHGNIIIGSVHRDEWDTVALPSAIERAGIHHARPIGKGELLDIHDALTWTLHGLGLIGVNRKNPDIEGLNHTQESILGRKGVITNYIEATRVHTDVLNVHKVARGIVFAAAANDSLIVPVGIAGLSSERVGQKTEQRIIARDKRARFGVSRFRIGPRLVFAFGDPLRLGPLPEFEQEKAGALTRAGKSALREETNIRAELVRKAVQKAHETAYLVRGSSLEDEH